MFKQIVYVHWKSVRWALLPMALAAFALPLLSVQGLGGAPSTEALPTIRIGWLLQTHSSFGPLFPMLAIAAGSILALTSWNWDHQANHVHALSLPLPRWKYALLKLGAGGVLLALVVAFFTASALVSSALVQLPEGLRAYPVALSFRFAVAVAVCYAFLFALAAGTVRTAVGLLSLFIGAVIASMLLNDLLVGVVPGIEQWSLTERILSAMVTWPGPFEVLGGNWMLIGV